MLLATTIELFDGLVARGIPGQGRLADIPDSARYDAVHLHVDVLVVGAGPAGLAAALTAARAGARVALVDEQSEAGGSLLATDDASTAPRRPSGSPAAVAELAGYPEVLHLQRTTAFGVYDDGFVLAVERRTDHLGAAGAGNLSRQRVWRIRAKPSSSPPARTNAPSCSPTTTDPASCSPASARTYLHRYGVLAGRRAVVFTTNDSAYAAAFDLAAPGFGRAVVDARPTGRRARAAPSCEQLGIAVLAGAVVAGTRGAERVTAALVGR